MVLCLLTVQAAADFQVCTSYGCQDKQQVMLSNKQWKRLSRLFHPPATGPVTERKRIARAIALLESIIGKQTGTAADRPRNQATGEAGQLDCIAESTNTDAYLRLLQQRGWLRFHRVRPRARRRPWIFDTHWSAVIEHRASGERFAVDSWFAANGQPPAVLPLDVWKTRAADPD
jgi:hypothetical protein